MSRRSILGLGAALSLVLAACSGGGATPSEAESVAPASAAPATPVASEAPASTVCMPSTDPATVEVAMGGRAFAPGRVQASVGDVISFTNEDPVPHTATLDDGSCTPENLVKGATGSLTFTVAGEYPFHCRIHPDMTGTFEIS
jgi:plastocyanin